MKIQSLSIAVPAGCPNKCRFCVAHMHRGSYPNQIEKNQQFRHLYKADYKKRLRYARDNGCDTLMFTGDGEPMLNQLFIEDVASWNRELPNPFLKLELQTSGWDLRDRTLRWLRNEVGISTISLSLSSFDNKVNAQLNSSQKWMLDIDQTCAEIKRYDFNLRVSLNMTGRFDEWRAETYFHKLEQLGANQVIFRELYRSDDKSKESEWVAENRIDRSRIIELRTYIKKFRPLRKLPYGSVVYDVRGISTIVDTDCMNQELTEDIKYLILREDCKLYSHWESAGSLIF